MMKRLEREAKLAELAGLEGLLQQLGNGPQTMLRAYQRRAAAIREDLRQTGETPVVTGSVALFFGGPLVKGARAIDAAFATRSVGAFQDMVSKVTLEHLDASLGERGPIAERALSRLNILGTVHGSFGFVLEEDGAEQSTLFPSAVKETISEVTELITEFAQGDDVRFSQALDKVDRRVLQSTREFFKALHDADGTVRIVESEREQFLDRSAIERGFRRADSSNITENDETVFGRLIGISPIRRTVEIRRDDGGMTIFAKVGPQLAQEFLERIEREQLRLGLRWKASIRSKTTERPGASPRISFLVVDLQEVSPSGA